jgi:tRNA threonylcarbamoyladenosine biosynthesis protein TsaE
LDKKLHYGLKDLQDIANIILDKAKEVRFVAFTGNLGAGKTTLIGEMIKSLGKEDFNGSPTFSLVNEYSLLNNTSIFHFDFYRLNNQEEAFDIGWEEYIQTENAWIFVEWPEKIENLLPEHFLLVKIEQELSNRSINLKMF